MIGREEVAEEFAVEPDIPPMLQNSDARRVKFAETSTERSQADQLSSQQV